MRQATIRFTSNKVEQPEIYDNKYYENEIAEVCEFRNFGPTYRIDGKPASDPVKDYIGEKNQIYK